MKRNVKKISYSIIRRCQRLPEGFSNALTWLLLAGVILLGPFRAALAQDISPELKVEHKVISIQEKAGPVPATVIIKRGTTVIWLNYSNEPNVIKFQTQKVTTACRAPINFLLADNGSYQSIPLQIGAVASLCFIEKGTFEYQIRRPDWYGSSSQQPLRGVIKVY